MLPYATLVTDVTFASSGLDMADAEELVKLIRAFATDRNIAEVYG